jgi:hypothetical protein
MNFDDKDIEIAKILLPFLTWISVVTGWIVTHHLTKRRDIENEKRKIRTQYLVNVFRFLATSISNRDISKEDWRKFEDTVSDIQLFGTPSQIILLKEITDQIVLGNPFELDPILNDIRGHLRKDLGLESADGNVLYLRENKTIKS